MKIKRSNLLLPSLKGTLLSMSFTNEHLCYFRQHSRRLLRASAMEPADRQHATRRSLRIRVGRYFRAARLAGVLCGDSTTRPPRRGLNLWTTAQRESHRGGTPIHIPYTRSSCWKSRLSRSELRISAFNTRISHV